MLASCTALSLRVGGVVLFIIVWDCLLVACYCGVWFVILWFLVCVVVVDSLFFGLFVLVVDFDCLWLCGFSALGLFSYCCLLLCLHCWYYVWWLFVLTLVFAF